MVGHSEKIEQEEEEEEEGEWKWLEANRRKIGAWPRLCAAKGQREARSRRSGDKNEATPVTTTERIKGEPGEKDGQRTSRRKRKIYIYRKREEKKKRKRERRGDIYADEEKAERRTRERVKRGEEEGGGKEMGRRRMG